MSNRKLTPELVQAIQAEPHSLQVGELANKYNLSKTSVTRARSGNLSSDKAAHARAVSLAAKITELLKDGAEMTVKQMSVTLNASVSFVSATVSSMERGSKGQQPQLVRVGFFRGKHSLSPIFRLASATAKSSPLSISQPEPIEPRRPLAAPCEYATPFAASLGEPPRGRSAYFQRYGVDLA